MEIVIIVSYFEEKKSVELNKGCVTLTVALPFTLKKYLKAKEELWKFNIAPCKNITFSKILLKKPKSFKIL